MKVLFIGSGNVSGEISELVRAQGDSLIATYVDVRFYSIKGRGIWGYLKNIKCLKKVLRQTKFDIIHAHYSLSGWLALFAKKNEKLIVSLMGDDAYGSYDEFGKVKLMSYLLIASTKILQFIPSAIIVKSASIFNTIYNLNKKKASIIPNGVNLTLFTAIDKKMARNKLNLINEDKLILFLGDPDDSRKNVNLAKKATDLLELSESLVIPYPAQYEEISLYLSAADVLLFTSTAEGSPNVIKEAMACNCPIVSTDVGDVKWIMGETEGCFLSTYQAENVAKKILLAMKFAQTTDRTTGRKRIIDLGLDSEAIARKIIDVYKQVLN